MISDPSPALSRQEQKERTRESILDAALALTQQHGFGQISLRQVTREAGIVPTAFYRHFESMEELGLALVVQSFSTLRSIVRDAQRDSLVFTNIIDSSVEILMRVVTENKAHFAFIARERFGGPIAIREAIKREIDLFINELAILIARLPNVETWSTEDVHMVAGLFVRNMVSTAEEVIEMPEGRPDLEAEITERARRQMRLIVLGFRDWRS